jgi:hypothetical protein
LGWGPAFGVYIEVGRGLEGRGLMLSRKRGLVCVSRGGGGGVRVFGFRGRCWKRRGGVVWVVDEQMALSPVKSQSTYIIVHPITSEILWLHSGTEGMGSGHLPPHFRASETPLPSSCPAPPCRPQQAQAPPAPRVQAPPPQAPAPGTLAARPQRLALWLQPCPLALAAGP